MASFSRIINIIINVRAVCRLVLIRRVWNCFVVLLLCNSIFLWNTVAFGIFGRILLTILVVVFYLVVNILPASGKSLPRKAGQLAAGCELLLDAAVCGILQLALFLLVWRRSAFSFSGVLWGFSIGLTVMLLSILLINGGIRLMLSSGQLTVTHRVIFFILWWVPLANVVLAILVYHTAHKELRIIRMRRRRDAARKEQRVCATRYPVILIHGIFFRDWKMLKYWGRIPEALIDNGATVYYGKQQSSSAVPASAEEIKAEVMRIVAESGCEKVNIIAHSKGGLDTRYAISCLGLAPYVASLTTVNTPHRGCRFARHALDKIPDGVVNTVSGGYDKLFSILGDQAPDFLSGVGGLTDVECESLNAKMPDHSGVVYQSVGSQMNSAGSAIFPLNLGYGIVKAVDGANDGLVTVESMPWGEFIMLTPSGKKGISHADVIDLTQKDIPGFDVCEFYVQLVHTLKEKGL